MPVGRANYNSTATAGSTKEVCPANASRTRFFFQSKGDTFVLNFGAAATVDNVLTIHPNGSIEILNTDAYDIRQAINVFCANASKFEAQARNVSMRVNSGTPPASTIDSTPTGGLSATDIQTALAELDAEKVNAVRPVIAKTASYTVLAADHGTIFTNAGAAGVVDFTLPASSECTAGKTWFTFVNLSGGTERNRVQVMGTDHLYIIVGNNPLDITGGATTEDDRNSGTLLTVRYIGDGVWIGEEVFGAWV